MKRKKLQYKQYRWAPRWSYRSPCAGQPLRKEHLIGVTFYNRALCRAYIQERYGYIKNRPDLRKAPFYWRLPQAVRVLVTTKEV